jgi:flagellar basal-body rod protein FlgF
MDQVSVIAASGIHSRMDALDMLANNLSNSTTGGFKLDREFYTLFSANNTDAEGSMSSLPSVKSQWTDFSQGTLQKTGSPLDFAISGNGFFVANGPSGPLYTRNGSFQLSPSGVLTTADGYPVSAGGTTIQTASSSPILVGADGTVQQDGQTLGQMDVVDFKDRAALVKRNGNYFVNSNPKVQPEPATDSAVVQGNIEGSNVQPAEAAVRLVGLMRQTEMLQKALGLTNDMNKQAFTEVARVGGGI